MIRKMFPVFTLLTMIAAMAIPSSAFASTSGAYSVAFTTSITYQNVGSGTANITVDFYNQADGSKTTYTPAPLAKNAGSSFSVGSVSNVTSGFKGSAVMSSDQPLLATLVQVPSSSQSDVKNRALSNGFSQGSSTVLIATILKNKFDTNSILSIQNVDTESNNISVNFYNASDPTAAPIVQTATIAPGVAKYYDMGAIASSIIPNGFNGSATITAVRTSSTSTAGSIIGSVMELHIADVGADAFEGVPSGANTYYMPIASCNFGGVQTSTYAVQNTDSVNTATVTVTYSDGKTATATILPGTKTSIGTCTTEADGFKGASTITSVGAQIIAIGKVTGGGLSTAFVGASSGASTIAVPYVRWTSTQYDTGVRQRGYIAIQNIGSDLPANAVTVQYVDKDGNVVGTVNMPAIPSGQKVNSNPSDIGAAGSEFGYYSGAFGGSAIITGPAGSKLVVICRIQGILPSGLTAAEDYNGIPFTPAS
jgi:hypothetical protein